MKSAQENLLIVSKLYQSLLQKRARNIKLTIAEWQLLQLVADGNDTQQALAISTNLDISTLSRQLSRLKSKGYLIKEIVRTEEKIYTRPASHYRLSEEGQDILKQMDLDFDLFNQQIFDHWSEEEVNLLTILLNRLSKRIEQIENNQ